MKTTKKYDPDKTPDLDEWRGTGEAERIEMVRRYHRKAGIELPNEQIHAAIHVIVENQIAEGDRIPVRETLVRLMSEGLDRHDALHAIDNSDRSDLWISQEYVAGRSQCCVFCRAVVADGPGVAQVIRTGTMTPVFHVGTGACSYGCGITACIDWDVYADFFFAPLPVSVLVGAGGVAAGLLSVLASVLSAGLSLAAPLAAFLSPSLR
jgi:hypothetical protein